MKIAMEDIVKLIGSADFPEHDESDLLKNFQSSCPPEVRNVAAFRAISKSLHVTGHVVRECLFALTAGSALCRDDKRLAKSYDTILDSQFMDPQERSQILCRNEDVGLTCPTGDKRKFLQSIIPNAKIKQTPIGKLKLGNLTVLPKMKPYGRTNYRKASILKNIFRRNSSTARRLSAQMQLLKACFVRLVRLPKNINLSSFGLSPQKRKNQLSGTRKLKSNPTNLSKNINKTSKKSDVQNSLNHLHLLTVQKTSEKLDVKSTLTTNLVKVIKVPTFAPEIVSIESKIESSIESNIESSIESNIESSIESNIESSIESNIESNIDKCGINESQKPIIKSKNKGRNSITEFNIFECRQTPKKQHIRPIIYDEVFRRRLSIVTADDDINSTPPMTTTNTISTVVTLAETPLSEKPIIRTTSKTVKKPAKPKKQFRSIKPKPPPKYFEKTNDILSQALSKSTNGKRNYHFRRNSSDLPRNLQKAKIVDAKQNGKFLLENDSLSQPLKHFKIPFSFRLPPSTEMGESEGLGKGRRESYHCHWDKVNERKKSISESSFVITNDKEHNPHFRKSKWYDGGDVSMAWRRTTQPYTNQQPYPGYFPCKSTDAFPTNGTTTTMNQFRRDFTGIEKYSSEVTTSNLISDAINQECSELERGISPNEVVYSLGDDYALPNDVRQIQLGRTTQPLPPPPPTLGTTAGGKITAEVYLNYSDFNFSTSMFVDDATCYEEFDYQIPAT